MVDDVIINKAASIERCIKRIHEDYTDHEAELRTNFTRQDAVVLNLLRACEAAIDMAMHIVRVERLGVPQSSRDAFDLIARAGHISTEQANQLKRMVGFRNIATHAYRDMNIDILEHIITERLDDFYAYTKALLKWTPPANSQE